MTTIIEDDYDFENEDILMFYKILNIIDDGELRTDWDFVSLSFGNQKNDHYYHCEFTPIMDIGYLPWQMLFSINKQFFHLYILRQNSYPNEGIQIKLETFFTGSNELHSKLNCDDLETKVIDNLKIQTMSDCFLKESWLNSPPVQQIYEFEVNDQSIQITIIYNTCVTKIDFISKVEKSYFNKLMISYTTKNGHADTEETAMRFDPDWGQDVDVNESCIIM
jgi:hypothetical protein